MIELLDIKVDVVFKDFFGDRNSKEIIESFINSVLLAENKIPNESCRSSNPHHSQLCRTGPI